MSTLNNATPATAYVSSTAASIFANPTTKNSYVTGVMFFNNDASEVVVELWNVPNSSGSLGSIADSNKIAEVSIPTKGTYWHTLREGFPLSLWGTNDAIFARAATANMVTQTVFVDVEEE